MDSKGSSDSRGQEVFDCVISSDLLPFNEPDTPNLLHSSSCSCSSPDISFAPSFLVLCCSWMVPQDIGSDHLPILLTVLLSPLFRPNKRPPPFNFQKARWDDFAFYFDAQCPSAKEYFSLPLSSVTALFTSLTLNAAKFSISFCCVKRLPQAWWSTEVEEAVSERHKAFVALIEVIKIVRLIFSASLHASPVITKSKAQKWQAKCSAFSPKSDPKTVYCILSTVSSLVLLPHLTPLPTSSTVLLPLSRLQS